MTQHTKDVIQYATAVATLLSGVVMCFVAFFGSGRTDVPSGALWYFGQTLVYAATIFGFKLAADEMMKTRK